MSTYPILKIKPEILKMKTRDEESKSLKYQTEKHAHEKILKTLKIDVDNYKKKYTCLKKQKVLIIITEIF